MKSHYTLDTILTSMGPVYEIVDNFKNEPVVQLRNRDDALEMLHRLFADDSRPIVDDDE